MTSDSKAAKKLFIQTHGCQMNDYDSSRMADLLEHSHGMSLTEDPAEADVLLLNTCSIREKAQEKVFHQLGRWRPLKEENPDVIIGVGGCVASQEGDAVVVRLGKVEQRGQAVVDVRANLGHPNGIGDPRTVGTVETLQVPDSRDELVQAVGEACLEVRQAG